MTTSEIYKLSGSAPKEKQKNRSTISFLPQLMHWRLYSGWLGWTWASSKGCFGEVMSWFTSEVTYGCVPFIRAHNGMLQGLCCFSLWCFSNYSSGIHIAEWKEIKSRHLNMCFGVTEFFISSGGLCSCTLRFPPPPALNSFARRLEIDWCKGVRPGVKP